MDAVRCKLMGFVGKKDNMINLFLVSAFVALGIRSSKQQQEIETLEAEKSSLKSGNKAMASSMWEWRQNLFQLAESDPSSIPIPLSKLRAIYGEDEPPTNPIHQGLVEDVDEDSTPIA